MSDNNCLIYSYSKVSISFLKSNNTLLCIDSSGYYKYLKIFDLNNFMSSS